MEAWHCCALESFGTVLPDRTIKSRHSKRFAMAMRVWSSSKNSPALAGSETPYFLHRYGIGPQGPSDRRSLFIRAYSAGDQDLRTRRRALMKR